MHSQIDPTQLTEWRRHLHAHPELAFEEHGTASFIVEQLKSFGIEDIVTGIGGTGIVASVRGGTSDRAIGLRADIDALPITERATVSHASRRPGIMHACGHDGHTTMLLGAAQALASTKAFDGTVHLIFQPAEETLAYTSKSGEHSGGATAMIDDGLFDRFPMESIFGIHNRPGLPAGTMAGRPGIIYAAADRFEITISGKGGHAARPHLAIDPIFVGAQLVVALQGIVSRMVSPTDSGVVSICEFGSGTSFNIIPDSARLTGTVRSLSADTRARIRTAMEAIAAGIGSSFGAKIMLDYQAGHPSVVNDERLFDLCRSVCVDVVGADQFVDLDEPTMGGEDFACYLKHKPGCFMLIGNDAGDDGSFMLHHPAYDFNDAIAPIGAAYWVRLAETLLSGF